MLKGSIIIPTYNRENELRCCIQSILKQTVKPYELIVIDDGKLLEAPLKNECKDSGISYIYTKKDRPGITESRNAGIKLASGDIIFFLDDDVVLSPFYIEAILTSYQNDQKKIIGGIGGVITNISPLKPVHKLRRIFDIIFLVSGFNEGKVLPSGFCTNYGATGYQIKRTKEVDFLSGCTMSFRKKIFQEFSFDEKRYLGYGLGEDQDFSYQVSRKHKLIINPKAKLLHMESAKMKPNKAIMGRKYILFKYLFFKQHVKKAWWNWILFYYALLGYILARTIILMFSFDKTEASRLAGILTSVRDILKGKVLIE